MAPFTILDHPADIGIEAQGGTLAEAFEQAAAAMMSIILDPATVQPVEIREIAVTATDREQLLVRWLAEVLYLYDGQGFAGRAFSIRKLNDTSLKGAVKGERFSVGRHHTRLDVKAVTYHQIAVIENTRGALVRVYLDI